VKTNLLVQMEILGRWLAIIVVTIAVAAFLLALLRAREPFVDAFESAVAIAGRYDELRLAPYNIQAHGCCYHLQLQLVLSALCKATTSHVLTACL
jgi:hypothetical protein